MIKFGKKIYGVEALIPSLVKGLSLHKNVVALYLFGSRATGVADEFSDVDIALLMDSDEISLDDELRLLGEISSLLHTDEVSLVILNKAPLSIAFGVITHSKVLFSQDEPTRLDFEEITTRKYFDFKHYLDLYDDAFIAVIRQEEM